MRLSRVGDRSKETKIKQNNAAALSMLRSHNAKPTPINGSAFRLIYKNAQHTTMPDFPFSFSVCSLCNPYRFPYAFSPEEHHSWFA
jgi:hypothetical protein